MPVYDYVALDKAGKKTRGRLEAETDRAARSGLRGQGLYPVELRPVGGERIGKGGSRRVGARDLAGALRQLAILLGAGLPVVEALSAAAEQAGSGRMGAVLGRVKDDVTSGGSLAEALSAHPKVFSDMAVGLIASGEASGSLEVVLERLADLLEARVKLTGRVRAALAYPAFMFVVGGLILTFLFAYVVPTISGIFKQTGQLLPWPTRALLAMADWVVAYGWTIPLAAAVIVGLVIQAGRTTSGRRAIDAFKLRLPLAGPIIRRLALVRFSRTMATLLQSGVPLVDALAITGRVVGNAVYARSLEQARAAVETGSGLADQLEPRRLWPPLVRRLAAAGERSAGLETVFDRLAQGLEEEVETKLTGLLSLLEPVIILILGGVVGFIVISILLPIFQMTRLVH